MSDNEGLDRDEIEENERWEATRFELSKQNTSWSKKAKILEIDSLWSILEAPPLLPLFVERKLTSKSALGRKTDNWSCIPYVKQD